MKVYRDKIEFIPINLVIETQEEYSVLRHALDHFANTLAFTPDLRGQAREIDFLLQEAWRK